MTLSAILFQNFGKVIILANYFVNKEFIANNLCENKAKPKMNCAGKCHLKKQLKKETKKEQSSPFKNLKEKNTVQLCSDLTTFAFPKYDLGKVLNPKHVLLKLSSIAFSIFHPPQGFSK